MDDKANEVVEAMARAMFDSHNATYTAGGPLKWESDPEHWRRYARAVLTASEPLLAQAKREGMLDAAKVADNLAAISKGERYFTATHIAQRIRALAQSEGEGKA